MTISLMGKHDLQDFIDKKDLDAINKEFGMWAGCILLTFGYRNQGNDI